MMRLAMRPAKSDSNQPTGWRNTWRCARQRIIVPKFGKIVLCNSATFPVASSGRNRKIAKPDHDNLGPMRGPNLLRLPLRQQIDQPPNIPDQCHVNRCHDHRQQPGHDKNTAKRKDVFLQKRPQLARRRIRLRIGAVGVNQPFEKLEHWKCCLLSGQLGYSLIAPEENQAQPKSWSFVNVKSEAIHRASSAFSASPSALPARPASDRQR